MQHCEKTVYLTDTHCADCGEQLKEQHTLKTVQELQPNILNDLKLYSPDADIITGKITFMYYYKRISTKGDSKKQYGYWWVSVEDLNENVFQLSIDGESESFKALKEGDVVSLISPTEYTLHYKIVDAKDKKTVKNNLFSPAVVAHNTNGQRSVIDNVLFPKNKTEVWFYIPLAVIVFCITLFGFHSHIGLAVFIMVLFTVPCLIWEIKRSKRVDEIALDHYQSVQKVVKAVLSITLEDLGYDKYARLPEPSDVVCVSCHCRIKNNVAHCYHCGAVQQKDVDFDLITDEQKAAITHIPIADFQLQLMRDYTLKSSTPYVHRNVLVKNEKGELQHECVLARVIDKVHKSDENKYTTTPRNEGNVRLSYLTAQNDDGITSKKIDQSFEGQLILETADFSILIVPVNKAIFESVDQGHWIFYAQSTVNMSQSKQQYQEAAYNLSTSTSFASKSVTKYSYITNDWMVLLLLTIAIIGKFLFTDADYIHVIEIAPFLDYGVYISEDITNLPLILFGVFFAGLSILTSVYALINGAKQKRSVAALYEKIATFKKDRKQIQQQINKL